MQRLGLVTALLCVAAHAAAQSHEPAPKPGATAASAGAHAPAANADVARAAPATKGEVGRAAPAHDSGPKPGEAAKKGPTVSRIATSPKPAAAEAPALYAETPAGQATGGKAPSGYVATSSRPKSPQASGAEKSKPMVSGADRAASPPASAAAHGTAPAPHGAPAPTGHGDAAASAKHTPPAKGPAKLATVHGRLAAALAEFRPEPYAGEREGDAHASGGSHARSADPARPRIALTWPKARWRVEWPDADRVTVAWPE